MKVKDFIEKKSAEHGISEDDVKKILTMFWDEVAHGLNIKGTVSFKGLGVLYVAKRSERKGRNPQTGREITIQSMKTVKFRPSVRRGGDKAVPEKINDNKQGGGVFGFIRKLITGGGGEPERSAYRYEEERRAEKAREASEHVMSLNLGSSTGAVYQCGHVGPWNSGKVVIARAVAALAGVNNVQAYAVINDFLKLITQSIINGKTISVYRIGSFRSYRCRTGAKLITFRPFKHLRDIVRYGKQTESVIDRARREKPGVELQVPHLPSAVQKARLGDPAPLREVVSWMRANNLDHKVAELGKKFPEIAEAGL